MKDLDKQGLMQPAAFAENKDSCLDYLRGAACLMVVMIHTTSRYLVEPGREAYRLLFSGLNTFAGSAVALFIFISGAALTLRYHQKALNYGTFLRRRMNKILLPYLFWAFFYLLAVNRGMWIKDGPLSLGAALLGFSMYHLYYIVIILQLYLLFPLLLRLHQRLPYVWLPLLFLILGAWTEKQAIMLGPWRITDRFCLTYGGYFSLGIYAGMGWPRWREILGKVRPVLLALWVILGTAASIQVFTQFSPWYEDLRIFGGYRYLIFAVASILFLSSAADWLTSKTWTGLNRELDRVSRLSPDIYFVHPLLLGLADRIWARLSAPADPVRFILTFITVFGGAMVFASLKEKFVK
jgi:surface polysaccharide O-acyltransferase-like enzyme